MEEYKESRKRNISLLLQERKHSLSTHETLLERLGETLETFHSDIEGIIEEIPLIKKHLKERNKKKEGLKDKELIKKTFSTIISKQNLKPELFDIDLEKTSKAFVKYEIRELSRQEEKIVALFRQRNRNTKALRKEVTNALRQGYSEETGLEILSLIDSFLAETTIKSLDEADRLIETLSSEAHETIYALTRDYIEAISRHKPELSKDRIRVIADLNLNHLDKSVKSETEKKRKYFDTLEGRVLAYATYALELKKADGAEETEGDLEYQIFLERKSKEVREWFKDINSDEIISAIKDLEEKGRITEDEALYLTAKLRSTHKKDDDIEEKSDEETKKITAMILEQDFKVSRKKSRELSRLVTEDSINKVYSALLAGFGDKQAKLLIDANPDLFYMDNGTLERYVQSVKELRGKTEKYSSISDFDFKVNPAAFASFEALHSTKARIEGLERTVLQSEEKPELKIMISRKALERARKDSYVSENIERYRREIYTISVDPFGRKKREKIGEFSVSPMGRSRKGLRVAWHFDGVTNTLYIVDLLYHKSQYGYVDDWNSRANSEINLEYYKKSGFEEYTGEI